MSAGGLNAAAAKARRVETPFERIARDFLANPVAVFGLTLLVLLVLAAIFAPLISPQNPYDLAQIDVMDSRLPPGSPSNNGGTFWLGTDDQGRDMLSAIFYGLRISLAVARSARCSRSSSASRRGSPRPTSAGGSNRSSCGSSTSSSRFPRS